MKSKAVARETEGPVREELLAASDAQIDDAVRYSDPMSLRGLVYQLTGDESLAAVRTTKARVFFADAHVPSSDSDVELIQARAAAFLKSYRDSGAGPIGWGPPERLRRSLELTAGERLADEEIEMWIEEAALDPWARELRWQRPPPAERLKEFSVLVIGAGLGGIGAAAMLQRAGIDFTVIERRSDIGGTWFENRYPGARVDTPSRAYNHIFGADFIFSSPFSPQSENERYFREVVEKHGLRSNIVFDTEVQSLTWDERTKYWTATVKGPDGVRQLRANAVISATGIYSTPGLPDIPGMQDFRGVSFHTSRWPAGLDVAGKRVAVFGTGATGYQMIPELAKQAGHVYVVQRKPQWIFPIPGYLSEFPPQVTWLDRNFPYHVNFLRFRTNWLTGEHIYGHIFNADPAWRDEHSRSALNKEIRDGRIAYIRQKFASRPELIDKMIPPHPPFSARPILVDEAYNVYDALLRDNVDLISGGVERINESGFVADGREYEADVLIYATGFKSNDLLSPMRIRGRGGRTIQEAWSVDGARAYVAGSMVPGFPNFFILYGPNTNPGHGGGIVNHEEMVTRFALHCFEHLILNDKRSVDVTDDAFERYNRELDAREALKIYTDPRAASFYVNKFGRSSVMMPFGPSELWRKLHPAKLDELNID